MPLTDFAVRHAKATGKKYNLRDSLGLFLHVTATGGRAWHFRYYCSGKQRPISFGTYPEVPLQEARTMRDEARSQLAKGINPHIERKKKQRATRLASDHTFAAVFEQWLGYRSIVLPDSRQSTLSQIRRGFENDVLPLLRSLSIYDVTRGHLLEVIQRIDARKSYSVADSVLACGCAPLLLLQRLGLINLLQLTEQFGDGCLRGIMCHDKYVAGQGSPGGGDLCAMPG